MSGGVKLLEIWNSKQSPTASPVGNRLITSNQAATSTKPCERRPNRKYRRSRQKTSNEGAASLNRGNGAKTQSMASDCQKQATKQRQASCDLDWTAQCSPSCMVSFDWCYSAGETYWIQPYMWTGLFFCPLKMHLNNKCLRSCHLPLCCCLLPGRSHITDVKQAHTISCPTLW